MKNLSFLECSKYCVTKTGEVYSSYCSRFLKQGTDKDGYKKVILTDDSGIRVDYRVHRLVALTYVDGYEEGLVVNHKNGIVDDNCVSNLEWMTVSENTKHSYATGLQISNRGFNVTKVNLVHEVCYLLEDGYKNREISEITQMDIKKVGEIKRGEYWNYISDQYDFDKTPKKFKTDTEKVLKICKALERKETPKKIAKQLNVSIKTVYNIKYRTSYASISTNFSF